MLSNDFNHIDQKILFLWAVFLLPIGYGGALFFLVRWVGPEGIIVLVMPLISFLVIGLVSKFISKKLIEINTHKDRRVMIISDLIDLLKHIKMYGWENVFREVV